jgi:hypothetical protein
MTYKRRITGTDWMSHQPTIPENDDWPEDELENEPEPEPEPEPLESD